jgi:hypothetical protein
MHHDQKDQVAYTDPRSVWRLLVDGWVFESALKTPIRIDGAFLEGVGNSLGVGPWTLVGKQYPDTNKPARKRLAYEEALKAERVEVEFPTDPNNLKPCRFGKKVQFGWEWDLVALQAFDLAERRGYPIYEADSV